MESRYFIMLSLKGMGGYECFGQFFLGDDKKYAIDVFSAMKGKIDLIKQGMLHMDLMEMADELPVMLNTICCNLDEFTCNCKFIAKEIFRLNTLEELS